MKRKPGESVPFELKSFVRPSDRRPFVYVTVGGEQMILTPQEARTLGAHFFDFAALSENDAAAVQVINGAAGEEFTTVDFVAKLMEARKAIREIGQRVN